MGEFSLTTKGWGSWESFLPLPKDRHNGRVFSHYQRMEIIVEFSLTTKGWGYGRGFSHYQRMWIMGEVSLTIK